jgi:hypothetical protein
MLKISVSTCTKSKVKSADEIVRSEKVYFRVAEVKASCKFAVCRNLERNIKKN